MNHYYSTSKQKTAGFIRHSCALLFMLFSFCYLFFLQGEILAEAQFVYSKGITSYNILIGAIIITVILQILQWLVSLLSRLPSRCHALSYLPSMLLLAMVTDLNQEAIAHFSFGDWLWVTPCILIAYILLILLVKKLNHDESVERQDIKSQIYPNFILLFLMMLGVGAIPQSTDVYHYELKAERLILAKDYEGAAAVGKKSLRTSARLTQLRMYALSKQDLLPECLFDYPQHYGSRGLLDIADTSSLERFTAQNICFHLGALCGQSIHTTDRYYRLMLGDTISNQHTADYYLCSLLLDKKLSEFLRQLPHYYPLSDSIAAAHDNLPRAYREALLQMGENVSDTAMAQRFQDYNVLKVSLKDETERINKTHREFGNTYWWYYDYSHLAKGELQSQP